MVVLHYTGNRKKTKIHFSSQKKHNKTRINIPEYPYYKSGNYKLNIIKIRNIINKLPNQIIKYPYYISPASSNRKLKPGTKSKPSNVKINNIQHYYPSYKHVIQPFINDPSPIIKTQDQEQKDKLIGNPFYMIIKSRWNDNLELNSLTDYFTEKCRVQCAFKNRLSPLEYWTKNHREIYQRLKQKHRPPTNYNLREEMYFKNKPCNNFRISVCMEVLRVFHPKSWLDISAGWGDRLLSALLYDNLEIYTGCDPNPCLHPYYRKMVETFDPVGYKKITLIEDGFETAKLPINQKYDLAFSSPPFFDLETYSNAPADSLTKYTTSQKWLHGFLIPAITKAIEYLHIGGYLVLYMGESQGTDYIPEMIKITNGMVNVRNAGMFYYTDGDKLREFYCWQHI